MLKKQLNIQQETEVIVHGDSDCPHVYQLESFGELSFRSKTHTQRRACFLCGQLERVMTKVVNVNPFSFEAIISRRKISV